MTSRKEIAARKRAYNREVAICQAFQLELEAPEQEGWAVYSGCEGEDPSFVAFVANERIALALAYSAKDPDEDEDWPLVFDGCAIVALLTSNGIVTSNHTDVDTHEKLREVYARSWVDDSARIVGQCIGKRLDCGCSKCKKASKAE